MRCNHRCSLVAAKRRKNAAHGASRGKVGTAKKPQGGERLVLTHSLSAGIGRPPQLRRLQLAADGLKPYRYFGCKVCAIITCRLKFSTIFASSRTAVGFLASVMVSILSCNFSSA
jgi:hypothetical protein